ncbi:sugar ABC transporter ATP-binding protein [Capillimicrobium parvum]|uniref:Galactose/methyl galactoside import ATP-binding protein MglA n=1 Tax=Capillimicrobium parvum TaxID=2884022 RepID=A0A9E7BXU6_9ACTN|nr:sugar ABC transporter ATP-binding protein [Capillimicrobium parvum]UGS34065.1 Galactose/methyl galactoside import ATP-binding protein MglA [Capillimicrobium parvum]
MTPSQHNASAGPADAGPATAAPPALALEALGLSKRYPGVRALAEVDLRVARGEVLGLVGENGAGKSTLLSILNGSVRPDSGSVRVLGRELRLGSPAESAALGVATVYQEQGLVPTLRVFENLFLGREAHFSTVGVLHRRSLVAAARETLDELGIDIDPTAHTGSLSFSERQLVEIAKAFALTAAFDTEPVILLDEPTSALTEPEVEMLLGNVRSWRDRASFVFVSHRLAHVLAVSDRIAALKDGELIADVPAAAVDEDRLHELIVGRKRDVEYYKEARQADEGEREAVLEVRGLSRPGAFADVSLTVGRGEILGVAGLAGCGKSEMARAIVGVEGYDAGEVVLEGRRLAPSSLSAAIRRGVGYVPAERRREGIIGEQTAAANLTLPLLDRLRGASRMLISARAVQALTATWMDRLDVRPPDPSALTATMSGGKQQKVVFAKWLARGVRLFVLDDPGRGLDVGAKEEIYGLLRDLCDEGVAILMVSDNLPEVIGLSHRIVVMRDGRLTAEIPAPADRKPDETDVVRHML